MKILWLGPYRKHMLDYVKSLGDDVVHYEKRIKPDSEVLQGVDFIVSYGYQFIIKNDVIALYPNKIVNLHISYLPWNRGTDPNMWSFLEGTPKGVTIHYIDANIDTGEILAQEKVPYESDDTLRTSYERLSDRIEKLFMRVWPAIRSGQATTFSQPAGGSFHMSRERAAVEHLLHSGWDTPVADLIGQAVAEQEDIDS
jgi:methionyl-tRNA formyltransferase